MKLPTLLFLGTVPLGLLSATDTSPVQLSLDPSFADMIRVAEGAETASDEKTEPDIHYVPTPPQLVDAMLDMAQVGEGDIVYDLGSGDGRLVITAATRRARGIGIEIDPKMIAEAEENARAANVQDRVTFRRQDLFKSDFREATVITLYLLEDLNRQLRPRIFAQVKPGTRLVSHAFRMGEWEPDRHQKLEINGLEYNAYFWLVPANLSGRWKVECGNDSECPEAVEIEQQFQKIKVRDGSGRELGTGSVEGTNFSFTRDDGGRLRTYRGSIDGNNLKASGDGKTWRATREADTARPIDPAGGTAVMTDV